MYKYLIIKSNNHDNNNMHYDSGLYDYGQED